MVSTKRVVLAAVWTWAQLIAAAPSPSLTGFLPGVLDGRDDQDGNANAGIAAAPESESTSSLIKRTNIKLPITNPDAPDMIPNRYIVVYNSSFSSAAIDAKMTSFSAAIQKRNLHKRALDGRTLSTEILSFKMNKWRAMALDADDSMIMEINSADEVAYVEADQMMKVQATIVQTNAPLGLQRLSEAQFERGGTYTFDSSAGEGMTVYVVDTGVRASHIEFEGRAKFAKNFIQGSQVCRSPPHG